jgi:uncharacterized protein (TIGR03067 family)
MRRFFAFLALLLLPLFLLGKTPEGRSDLEGDWRVVGMESGDRTPCSLKVRLERIRLTFKDASLTVTAKGQPLLPPATFTLDARRDPKGIDVTVTAQKQKLVLRGVYALDGGRLRIALPFNDNAERPAAVKAAATTQVFVGERATDASTDPAADALAELAADVETATADRQARRVKAGSADDSAKRDAELASTCEAVAGRLVKLADKNPGRLVEVAALSRAFAAAPRSAAGKKALDRLTPTRLKEVALADLRDVVEGLKDTDDTATLQQQERFARVLLGRVEQSPTHADAAWLLNYLCGWSACEQEKVPESFAGAAALIRKHHLASPDIANVCEHLGGNRSGSAPAWAGKYDGLLRAIAKENPSRYVRGQAAYALPKVVLGAGEAHQDEAIELFRAYQKEFDSKDPPTANLEGGQRRSADKHIKTIRALWIGKPAPALEGVDTEGKPLKLADYKGRVVVMSVWGTWCLPCMKFVAHERKLVERMKGKPFALLGINVDDYNEAFHARVKKEGITWRSFQDRREGKPDITEELSLIFPSVVLIDHAGIVRGWWRGAPAPDVLDREIDKLVEAVSKK